MDIETFLHSIIPEAAAEEILTCNQLEDLTVDKKYRIIALEHLIDNIPVFEMEGMWEKINRTLCEAGLLVIKTNLYENPNELDRIEIDFKQIRCNKQTEGTLIRECLKQNYLIAESDKEYFLFIRRDELSFFSENQQKSFSTHHEKLLGKYGLTAKETYDEEDFHRLVPGAGRVLIGCIAENNQKYQTQALRLIQSIRWFGGKTAGANIFVCMVDDADPGFIDELNKWNVFVQIVKRFSALHPPSNKLRLFELPEAAAYDTIILLDCDTVIVQDPYPYIDGVHFQAEIAAGATVPNHLFKRLFSHYRLQLPQQKYMTAISKERTIWYCNAGVLIFPNSTLKTFYPIWKDYTIDLSKKKFLLDKHYFYCEQASLSIAFASQPVPFKRLPVTMNYHLLANGWDRTMSIDPIIIHYHHNNDQTGFIINTSKNPQVHQRIKLFNHQLKNFLEKIEQR